MNKNKVSDMAKDFGLTSKDILSVLSTYEDGSKKPSQVLSADEVNLIFEHLTQKHQVKIESIYAESAPQKKTEPKATPAPAQNQPKANNAQNQPRNNNNNGGSRPQPQQGQQGKPAQPQQNAQPVQQQSKSTATQHPTTRVPEKKIVDTRKVTNVNLDKYDEKLQDMAERSGDRRDLERGSKEKFRNNRNRNNRQQPFSGKRKQEEAEKMRRLQLEIAKKTPLTVKIPDEISVGDFFANMTSQQYRESRKTAEKPAYTPAGARPVSAPQSAPVKPAPAPQWQTRVPAIDTQSGGKAALSDYVRHETPASAPVLSAQQSQPVEKSVHSVENHDDEVVTLPMPEEDARPVVTGPIIGPEAETAAEPEPEAPAVPVFAPAKQEEPEIEQTTFVPPSAAPWRIAGEVLDTYIVCEDEDKNVWLIDKHAAHERVNFDRMKANQEPLMCQALLAPLVAEFAAEEYSALAANLELLREFGFECEEFGGGSLILRAIPADIDSGDAIPALEELADKLVTAHTVDPAAARDALLHTMACKAAIKGGWKSDLSELRVLVDKVQSGEVQFCPHGRPVKAKLTKYELEKMFKRA